MSFEKVETQVDYSAQENEVQRFWDESQAFDKLREQNKGKPEWSFLDGPITANNPMGVHHAWGRTYKDAYQRYHAMTGHELRYQNGFDCQGLWVEVEVEKELGIHSKRDIENLVDGDRFASIDKFVQLCKERVDKFARIQTEQSIRLGYWMDWDRDEDWHKPPDERRSYFTMSEENNYTIWSFLKKCHERKLVYKAYDAMPWCPRCAVGLSQMEMHEGYKLMAHRAVFVSFPLRERPGENLLVWTTTPWTLTSNVAAAVNPKLTYVKVRHQDQAYYVAKGALTAKRLEDQFKSKTEWIKGVPKLKSLEQMFKEKGGLTVESELIGQELIGWTYDGPFDELPAQDHAAGFPKRIADVVLHQDWGPTDSAKQLHRVIAWEDVGEEEGTGIVHIAPGCGKEDFGLGRKERLVPIAPLDEEGRFVDGFEGLTGKGAADHETTDWIIDNLREKGRVFAVEQYPHSYPHCWRCKTELLFRLVDEWFIDMSWRDEIMKVCEDVQWIPEFGKQRELDWLKNMGDWMISKKRFWGLALPIWVDEKTGDFEVIGSRDELKERAVEGWEAFDGQTPHRPWIDKVKIRNPKNGHLMSRIPDVGNPWLDAGIVPYSTLKYNSDREYWKEWFPANFITECFPGQFRNWFYALLAMSTMMEQKAPFKVLLGHALVRDEHGNEMHKTAGNAIPFEEAAEKMGADIMRWMFCRNNPVHNINFGYTPAKEIRSKLVDKLWNVYAFFCNYARLDEFKPFDQQVPLAERPDIDRWILSDLQLLIHKAHEEIPKFNIQAFCLEAERFVDDRLSNWYVRRNRRRFWKSEKGDDKAAAYQTLYSVLVVLTKMFAPIMPFLTEKMYQNLIANVKNRLGFKARLSVHLASFPSVDESLIDAQLSADMDGLLRLVSLGSAARNSVKIKVRQPLAELKVQPADDAERNAVERFAHQICEELNIKKVTLHDPANGSLLKFHVKPNMKSLGPKFGQQLKQISQAVGKRDATELATEVQAGKSIEVACGDEKITLEPSDLIVEPVTEDCWASLSERGTQIALDARITGELELEGIAREVIRYVQQARKDAELQMEDRIALHLDADDNRIDKAIEKHREYIARETLATVWAHHPLDGNSVYRTTVKLNGRQLKVELRRV